MTCNGQCFSDGVGMISQKTLADSIASSLTLDVTPSAFQIRKGGAKGMLTVVPDSLLKNGTEG